MKKSIIHLLIALFAITGFQSCKKDDVTVTTKTTVTDLAITLNQNESYQFILPANTTKQPYQITTAASNSSISLVNVDANGNELYSYTPALDYTGTDKVTVENITDTTCEEKKENNSKPLFAANGNCNGPKKPTKGDCNKDKEAITIQLNKVNIVFTIEKTTTSSTVITRLSN